MKIVVNHLTRIKAGYLCVAGVDVDTGKHVRPVLAQGPLPVDLLVRYGGPFDVARIVELGAVRPRPDEPHVEDCVIVPSRLRPRGALPAAEFWNLLQGQCKNTLRAIFGDGLVCVGGQSRAVHPGKGEASLGCLRPQHAPSLQYLAAGRSGKPEVRIAFSDAGMAVNAAVTDIRLYGDDHFTPRRDVVEGVARRIRQGEAVILGVGLTRPFASRQETDPVCWLQVTNVHLGDNPAWELG